MRCLCIGDRIEDGTYWPHSRFERVANFSDGRRLLSLVMPEVGAGPANLLIEPSLPASIAFVEVNDASFSTDAGTIDVSTATRFDSRLVSSPPDIGRAIRGLDAMEAALLSHAGSRSLAFVLDPARAKGWTSGVERETMIKLKQGVYAFDSDCLSEGIVLLKGCGGGLTPNGDDFIAGTLAAWKVLRFSGNGPDRETIEAVRDSALGGNLLSNAFIGWAAEGRGVEAAVAVAQAVCFEGEKAVRSAVRRLCSMGESSGADWGVGFLLALRRGWTVNARGGVSPAEKVEAV